jgi:hypothetical protein
MRSFDKWHFARCAVISSMPLFNFVNSWAPSLTFLWGCYTPPPPPQEVTALLKLTYLLQKLIFLSSSTN